MFPAYSDYGLRIVQKNGEISQIAEFDPLTGDTISILHGTVIYPAKHYMTDPVNYKNVFPQIKKDLAKRVEELKSQGKVLEAHRLNQKTTYDLQMIEEVGFVNVIENYSRYFDGRKPGEPPYSLLNYFDACAPDWLTIIDE